MCEFTIYYSNLFREPKWYSVQFDPWPTWAMLHSLATTMLIEKGGCKVVFTGPNGLQGFVERS